MCCNKSPHNPVMFQFTAIGVMVEPCIDDSLSVVVSPKLCREIRYYAGLAEADRLVLVEKGLRSLSLSKSALNPHIPEANKNGLCPLSGLPKDTLLSKLASKSPKGQERFNFTVLDDQRMPFFGSMGPNIVEIDPQAMNLYSLNDEDYIEYLTAFFKFRTSHIIEILTAYVRTIKGMPSMDGEKVEKQGKGAQPLGSENTRALYAMEQALTEVISKLSRVINVEAEFAKTGLSISSFCQTWMKNGTAQKTAEFSIMSPHFQTRLNINSVYQFLNYVGDKISPHDIDLLTSAQITSMNGKLEIPGIKFADYTGAFVDVDGTWRDGS